MATHLTRRAALGALVGGAVWSLAACQTPTSLFATPPTRIPAHPTRLGIVLSQTFAPAFQQELRNGYQQAVDAVAGTRKDIDRQISWIPIGSAQQAADEIATAFIGAANGGTAVPDLLVFGNRPSAVDSPYLLSQLLTQPLLRSIDAEFRRSPGNDTHDYYPNTLDTCRVGGTLYGLPLSVDPSLFLVDPRLVGQAAGNAPGAWNWQDTVSASQRLTRAPSQYAFAPKGLPSLETFLWQHGTAVLSADGSHSNLDAPAAIEAATFYGDLFTRDKVVAATVPNVASWTFTPDRQIMYNKARIAMLSTSSVAPGRPLEYREPFHDQVKATEMFLISVLAMTVRATDPTQSFSVMTALATELQRRIYPPPRRSLLERMQPDPALSGWTPANLSKAEQTAVMNALGYARPSQVADTAFAPSFYNDLQAPLQQGTKKAADACRAVADAINRILQGQKKSTSTSGKGA